MPISTTTFWCTLGLLFFLNLTLYAMFIDPQREWAKEQGSFTRRLSEATAESGIISFFVGWALWALGFTSLQTTFCIWLVSFGLGSLVFYRFPKLFIISQK